MELLLQFRANPSQQLPLAATRLDEDVPDCPETRTVFCMSDKDFVKAVEGGGAEHEVEGEDARYQ